MGARGPRDPRPPGAKEAPESPSHGATGWRRALSPTRRLCWPGVLGTEGCVHEFLEGRKGQRVDFRSPTSPTPSPSSDFPSSHLRGDRPSDRDRAPPGFGRTRSGPGGGGWGADSERARAAPSAPPSAAPAARAAEEESRPGRRRPGSSSPRGPGPSSPPSKASGGRRRARSRARWVRPSSCHRRLRVPSAPAAMAPAAAPGA